MTRIERILADEICCLCFRCVMYEEEFISKEIILKLKFIWTSVSINQVLSISYESVRSCKRRGWGR